MLAHHPSELKGERIELAKYVFEEMDELFAS